MVSLHVNQVKRPRLLWYLEIQLLVSAGKMGAGKMGAEAGSCMVGRGNELFGTSKASGYSEEVRRSHG